MCTWRRLHRLPRTIQLLAEQSEPVALHIWNNNRAAAREVDALIPNAAVPTVAVHSKRNIGGFGRFYMAHSLASSYEKILFIDDDQEFGPTMVADQLADFTPESIGAWWAFRFDPSSRDYGTRVRAEVGEHAHYVGTCGMITDAAVFTDPRLFECPRRFWYVEDLWLSYVAQHLRGWRLYRSRADFVSLNDENDLFRTLGRTKTRLLRYLLRQGWLAEELRPPVNSSERREARV